MNVFSLPGVERRVDDVTEQETEQLSGRWIGWGIVAALYGLLILVVGFFLGRIHDTLDEHQRFNMRVEQRLSTVEVQSAISRSDNQQIVAEIRALRDEVMKMRK